MDLTKSNLIAQHFAENPDLVTRENERTLQKFVSGKRSRNPSVFYTKLKQAADAVRIPNTLRVSRHILVQAVQTAYTIIQHLLSITEKGLKIRMWVVDQLNQKMRIRSIEPDGFIRLYGTKGRFRPSLLTPCTR